MHQTIKSPIKYKLVFYGHDKKDKQCNEVCQMLNTHNIYPAYLYELNNANGSIVYDFSTNQFYGMDEDRLFYEYELGSINKKLDPLEEYYRNGYTK